MNTEVPFIFERLDVYVFAIDFADKALALAERFGHRHIALADQLSRAAISIPANIAEGNGRATQSDRRKFFVVARGSLNECVPMLEIAHRRRLISDLDRSTLRSALHDISRMLAGLIKNPGGRPAR